MEERCAMFASRFPDFALNPDFEITDSFVKQIIHIYCFCDTNTNSVYREKLVAELVKAGIHVHVYGNGWDDVDFKDNPYFHFGGFLSQEDCILKMQNTKFILNSMPWFKDGTHDRIYNAMLSGGLCITDSSLYLQEQFTHREDILFYSLDEIEKLPELLRYYENHPTEAEQIIQNGYDKVVLCHTWQNRCLELLEYAFHNMF